MNLELLFVLFAAGLLVELLLAARRAQRSKSTRNKWIDFARVAIWLGMAALIIRLVRAG